MYLSIEATILDGKSHSIQLYSDITGQWISSDKNKVVVWHTNLTTEDVRYHYASLQSPEFMKEVNNIAEDSTIYYAMQTVHPSLSFFSDFTDHMD